MCGITGIVTFDDVQPVLGQLEYQMKTLIRRGPDDSGQYVEKNIALGHRRLSIIDLTTGQQPMLSKEENVVLVFNGEIYNFQRLRKELETVGRTFETASDTEVVIQAYQEWGLDHMLKRLEGMFAFALYDKNIDQVFIVRDRFGEKPLYYVAEEKEVRFASELKALEKDLNKEIDLDGLNYFLALSYIPAPYTIYKGVKKLEQGHYLKVGCDGDITKVQYYSLMDHLSDIQIPENLEEAKTSLKKMLTESVRQRMVSDVPVGAFLSGGIDSSIVAALMAQLSDTPVNTFSIGFKEPEYDESNRAKLVADHIKSNHTVHKIDYEDVIHLIDNIIDYFDEPYGDSSAIPSYCVAKLAAEKVKVVLTGDCADELFGGYEKYLGSYYRDRIGRMPKPLQQLLFLTIKSIPHNKWTNSFLRRAKKVMQNINASPFDLHYNMMCLGFNDDERQILMKDRFTHIKPTLEKTFKQYSGTSLEKGMYTDVKYVLEGDMLTKVDRVCMQNSLEARVPFLDSEIARFAFSLPVQYKIRGKNKKYILKEAFKDMLPGETIGYRKKGFGVPVDYWFKNQLKPKMEDLIQPDLLAKQGIFNVDYVQKLWKEHQAGIQNHKGKLWNIYVFQKWYQKHVH